MKVSRLYPLDSLWYRIVRLWDRITVFDEFDSDVGRAMTIKRLKEFHEGVGKVIDELETEEQEISWLK